MHREPMSTLPASLEESARLFPLPEGEARRIDLRKWILNYVPKGGVGAEVGALRGHFSELLLQWLEPRKATFIDTWTLEGELFGAGRDPLLTAQGELPTALARQEARWRTERFANVERRYLEDRFPECAPKLDDRLDWLYLDLALDLDADAIVSALHVAEGIMTPKGIVFGNGWWPNTTTARNAVFQGVTQFTRKTKYEIVAAGPYGQWAMRHRGAWKAKK